jgi:hypothetical protein
MHPDEALDECVGVEPQARPYPPLARAPVPETPVEDPHVIPADRHACSHQLVRSTTSQSARISDEQGEPVIREERRDSETCGQIDVLAGCRL